MFEFLLTKKRSVNPTFFTFTGALPAGPHYILFGGGVYGGTTLKATYKYYYDTGVTGAGTSLAGERKTPAATGSLTDGYFHGGYFGGLVTTSEKYGFSSNAVSQATRLIALRMNSVGVGNDNVGIIGGGDNVSAWLASTEKYTYASQLVTAGVGLAAVKTALAGVSNYNFGIFSLGYAGGMLLTSEKYNYFTDIRSSGTALKTGRAWSSGMGNNNFGLFVAGTTAISAGTSCVATVEQYNYANDAVSTGTLISARRVAAAGSGNPTTGFIIFGSNGSAYLTATEKCTYSSMTWSAGTVMPVARENLAAASSHPSWV